MIMRDSIDARKIPLDGLSAVAGYGDGRFQWSPSWIDGSNWWSLFPSTIVQLVIVVSAADKGDILDVETSDATPAQVPAWLRSFARAQRRCGTVYCNRSTWPIVINALHNAGIDPAGPMVDYWIATDDGTQDVPVPAGGKPAVAVQYLDTGGYDETVIHDPTWIHGEDMSIVNIDPADPVAVLVGKLAYVILPPAGSDGAVGEMITRIRDTDARTAAMTPQAIAQAVVAALPPGSTTFTAADVATAVVTALAGKLSA